MRVVDEVLGHGPGWQEGIAAKGGDLAHEARVVRAVLDERGEGALVRMGPGDDRACLLFHFFDAPLVSAQKHEVVDRVSVKCLEHVMNDRVTRREEADRVENGRRSRQETTHVVQYPRYALARVKEFRL